MRILVNCDGSLKGKNPGGHGVGGFVIKDESDGSVLHSGAVSFGIKPEMTNNYAEYGAVLEALKCIRDMGLSDVPVLIKSDSMLVIRQLTDKWECKNQVLRGLRDEIWRVTEDFLSVEYDWVPRTQNRDADAMSRSLYDDERP